jgi:hemoglobin-like flavoprotein
VRNSHYAPVGEALIGALREELSGYFNPEVEQAWEALYDLVARAMRGEEIPPVPLGPE